jgi:hypothetical protein
MACAHASLTRTSGLSISYTALYFGSPGASMVRRSPAMTMVSGWFTKRVTETTPGTFNSVGTCSWS